MVGALRLVSLYILVARGAGVTSACRSGCDEAPGRRGVDHDHRVHPGASCAVCFLCCLSRPRSICPPRHCGDTYTRLAAGFRVGVATVCRYVHEAIDVLAALGPTLPAAIPAASPSAAALSRRLCRLASSSCCTRCRSTSTSAPQSSTRVASSISAAATEHALVQLPADICGPPPRAAEGVATCHAGYL